MERVPPVKIDTDINAVFDNFRKYKDYTFFPVLDEENLPIGIIRELDLKDYTYHMYGRDLLRNRSSGMSLIDFVTTVPVTDIHTSAEKILEIFTLNENVAGILITDRMKYAGFLSAQSLLKVINEKNLTIAREQNPLTRLPGNMLIHEFVSKGLDETNEVYALVYFDFDNFKPFNDKYGFRIGDRVIQLFGDILKKQAERNSAFAGHIGGDDFFFGCTGMTENEICSLTEAIAAEFKSDVESFYDEGARKRGYITAKDREGNTCEINLLTVSAVVLTLPPGRDRISLEKISGYLGTFKKEAKKAESRIYHFCISDI
jgi:diguanylate cyclase (GGDEF)-like protein